MVYLIVTALHYASTLAAIHDGDQSFLSPHPVYADTKTPMALFLFIRHGLICVSAPCPYCFTNGIIEFNYINQSRRWQWHHWWRRVLVLSAHYCLFVFSLLENLKIAQSSSKLLAFHRLALNTAFKPSRISATKRMPFLEKNKRAKEAITSSGCLILIFSKKLIYLRTRVRRQSHSLRVPMH